MIQLDGFIQFPSLWLCYDYDYEYDFDSMKFVDSRSSTLQPTLKPE